MKQNNFVIITIVLLLLISGMTQELSGQSELLVRGRAFGISARAMGMGGAYTSVAEDYSATYWNPAGLAMMRRMEFFISMPNTRYQTTVTHASVTSERNENFTKLNSIGFAFPIPTYRGSLVFAFGYNRVRNFDQVFEFSWFNPNEDSENPALNDLTQETWDTLEKGHLGQYTFSGAMDISPNMSLGASINLWRGKNTFEDNYQSLDVQNLWDLDEYGVNNTIESELKAVNLKLGGLYRLGRFMRLAGAVELPYTLKINENSTYRYWEYWEAENPYEENEDYHFEYEILNPFKFSAGASMYLPLVTLAADVNYADWSQMEYQTEPPFSKANPVEVDGELVYYDSTQAEINRDIRKLYRATTTIHVGGELNVPFLATQLRAGVFVEPSIFKNEDSSRKYFTVGAGLLLDKQMKLDVNWIHGWWTNETSQFSNYIPLLTEDVKLNQIEVSLAIRF